MSTKIFKTIIMLALFAVSFMLPAKVSFAQLGNTHSSWLNMQNSVKTKTIHSLWVSYSTKSFKNSITEYEDLNGRVFAVKWHGTRPPDMKKLLGTYRDEYSRIMLDKFHGGRRGGIYAVSSNIILSLGGHMGDVHGFVYIPAFVPAGVNIHDILAQ